MGNLSKFQIIIIGFVVFLIVVVVLIVGGVIPGLEKETDQSAQLVFWGFDEPIAINEILARYREIRPKVTVQYQQKNLESFEDDLLNAISRGQSPDVVVFPSYDLEKHKDKLSTAPPILITQREIEQKYIDAGQSFTTPEKGVLGVPLFADALVLFYNKDLFNKNFITLPPITWDEFLDYTQKITQKTGTGEIDVAGTAMGRAQNIAHAPLILTTLFLQSGEKIIGNEGGVTLGDPIRPPNASEQIEIRPAESALRFFTDFASQRKASFAWSLSLPEATDTFLSGKLGMYFGPMSEYEIFVKKNPHLAFSVAPVPNFQGAPRATTAGTLFAVTVPKASANQRAAWNFSIFLGNSEISALYGEKTDTVSVRRDVLPIYASSLVKSVFAKSVLSLVLWPDPDKTASDTVFRSLIEDVAQGRLTLREALLKANGQLTLSQPQ